MSKTEKATFGFVATIVFILKWLLWSGPIFLVGKTLSYPKRMFWIYVVIAMTVTLLIAWGSGNFVPLIITILLSIGLYFAFKKYGASIYHRYQLRLVLEQAIGDFFPEGQAKKHMTIHWADHNGNFRVDFRVPYGKSDAEFMKVLPAAASALGLVKFMPIDLDDRAGYVTILFCFNDPLEGHLRSEDAPVLHLSQFEREDPYLWLPIGVNALGEKYEVPLFLKDAGAMRRLDSGKSGAGKSSAVLQHLLFAAMNPYIDLAIADMKGGSEFPLFKPYASAYATDKNSFFDLLRYLEKEVARRSQHLAQHALDPGRFSKAWNSIDDGNFILWVWDELINTYKGLALQEMIEIQGRVAGIASVARSLGIAIIFSSQTFRSDVLETKVRDNMFDLTIAFQAGSLQDAEYVGFSSSDEIRPDLIKGKMLPSGNMSTAGQFATRGLKSDYGKTYYLPNDIIAKALDTTPIEEITTSLKKNGEYPELLPIDKV
ncbi:hypothetical protein [Leifsonia sp. TF02-11]|uniref:hypothetical protein n=1 Tax=Leifsonia sp. TF02-11 TaxID=2815212 RepID=UPI001AA12AA1|nr:hypothetical protein [Leifsonia sp. TF02-11]MBO1739797.1 hypothetical protein [Leifsonia sp. TF02-11]